MDGNIENIEPNSVNNNDLTIFPRTPSLQKKHIYYRIVSIFLIIAYILPDCIVFGWKLEYKSIFQVYLPFIIIFLTLLFGMMLFDHHQYTSNEIEPNGEKIRKILENEDQIVITISNYNEKLFSVASIVLFLKIINEFLIFYTINKYPYQNQQLLYWGVLIAYDLFAIGLIYALFTKSLTYQVKFVHQSKKSWNNNVKILFRLRKC